ncbi:MAG: choice-of-anchor E domain-containing protein [Luteolibacter sp.]
MVAGLIALFATSSGYAQTAESLVQTQGFSFTPNGNVNLTFAQFDDQGGTLVLTGVEITVTYTKTGGSLSVDNDSSESGSIDLSHTIVGNLTVKSGGVSLIDNSYQAIGSSLNASSTATTTIGATTGDSTTSYDNTGLSDNWVFSATDVTATDSGTILSALQSAYVGTGNFVLNFAATQTSDIDGLGGVNYALVNSAISGAVTVTYTYEVIPEPSSVLLGLGSVGLFFLRRRR